MKNLVTTIGLSVVVALAGLAAVSASEITGGLSNQGVIPVTPSGVTATKTGEKEITTSWSTVAGVEGYMVYRIKDGTPAVIIATTTVVT